MTRAEFIHDVMMLSGLRGVKFSTYFTLVEEPGARIRLEKDGYYKDYRPVSDEHLERLHPIAERSIAKLWVDAAVEDFLAGLAPEKNGKTPRARVLAVDFDGCLCENRWPSIGPANRTVIDALKARKADGWKLILWTCREGELLEDALKWCAEEGVTFDAVNDNLPETVKEYGANPRKVSADEYWDDHAVRKCYGENV